MFVWIFKMCVDDFHDNLFIYDTVMKKFYCVWRNYVLKYGNAVIFIELIE